jgi:hypothetical protein
MGKKLSTFIGDSTYTRAPPNYRSPLRSNYHLDGDCHHCGVQCDYPRIFRAAL